MGRTPDKIVTSFAQVVRKHLSPCRIILFGSRARKRARKDSDYDFLLVSPKFTKWEFEGRSAYVYTLKKNIPAAMDIICLTPPEFERKKNEIGIVHEAVQGGIEA